MADITGPIFTAIFISILLAVGALVFAYSSDIAADQYYPQETIIVAGCSDDNATTETTLCTGTANHIPIENGTRVDPVVRNCSSVGCVTLTDGTHYNYSESSGVFSIITSALGDVVNGSIEVDYWEDTWSDNVDNAQQSISSIAYSGFDLAIVIVIVIAAVAIVGGVMLIGKRE